MVVSLLVLSGGGLILASYLCYRFFSCLNKKKDKPPSSFMPRGVDDTEGGFWEIIRYR